VKSAFPKSIRIFLPFALGYFLSYFFRVINAVLAPDLAAGLGMDPSDLGLLTSAYFIAFAAFQLPLGVLLDRFGPRIVEALLLVVAAGGAFVFGQAHSLAGLVVGRAMIGFGVSACLMAAFKAFVMWFPKQQLPQINGVQMAAGGLGALAATAPVQFALTFTDWRGVFTALASLTLLVAVLIFVIVPPRPESPHDPRLSDQLRGIGRVLRSKTFWRIAPWATASQAAFLSIHGLWSGPWLRDVAGLSRSAAAGTLSLVAAAMVAGFIGLGTLARHLARKGVATMSVAVAGMAIFSGVLGLVALELKAWPALLWMLFGFFGTSSILPYAALSQSFPLHLSGRVNTALNLLVFVAAFAAQWGIGAVIGQWPATAAGGYDPQGYQAAFGIMLVILVVTMAWYFLAGRFRCT
jgi:MFS family permease